ncbi:MAG: hypothetical protein IJZ95_07260 [Oscillospiraceae bacterium]|nr:hypothetical protein [Oscillospiraceae bacterium]
MTGSYDGSIRIDTSINTQAINTGLSAIENKIKGLGVVIGTVFSVKQLIDFGTNALTAASDLAEAQNVVDTAFGSMSYKMEQFADKALETYGISELTAKQMGSTYMAMAKGMGVATTAASDMAVTLTGRLSDIMSFYNKTQEQVDTIGRGVLTGETEPLKQIGVVMTQTNLAAYAMAQGFEKAYDEMSASEQLIVRYKYFLEQTALAQGDFAKTSEGWANQTRLLNERWTEFMTNLGGVLINTFTPALRFANEAVSFLNELFFGGRSEEDTTAAKNAEAIADELTSVGTAAEKSQKKLNGLLSGFDELHVISGASDSVEDKASAGIDTSNLLGVNLEADTNTAKKAANRYREILNEIYLAFKRHPLTKIIEEIIGSVGDFFGLLKDNGDISYGGAVNALMDILTAILAYKAVSGVTGAVQMFSSGFGGLLKVITAHPVAAVAVGIGALAIGIYELDRELKRQAIAEKFGDISISLEEIDTLVSPISDDLTALAAAFSESKTKIADAKENFEGLSKSIQSVFASLEQGEKVNSSITDQIDEWIDAALGYNDAVLDKTALQSLAATDSIITAEEQAILDNFDDLENSLSAKIETIRSQIHEITQAAADENRALMESELENIQELYSQIAQMTATQSDVQTSATWERLKNKAYTYESYDVLLQEMEKAREQSEAAIEKIEKSAYEQMMSVLMMMEKDGATEAEINAEKERYLAMINDTLKNKQQETLMYEMELLDAFAEAHDYSGIMDEKFMQEYNNLSSETEKEKAMQYYKLYKKAWEGGATREQIAQLEELAKTLGDESYSWAISAIAGAVAGTDETYGSWGTERQAVIDALADLGYECRESYSNELAAVVEDAGTLDGTKLLSDITAFTKLGTDSGQAFVDAVIACIENSNLGGYLNTNEGLAWLKDNFFTNTDVSFGNNLSGWWGNTAAGYGQQPSAAGTAPYNPSYYKIEQPIYIDGVYQDTVTIDMSTATRPNPIINNAKGQ